MGLTKLVGWIATIASFWFPWTAVIATAAFAQDARAQAKRQRRRAVDEYNANLQDRLEMFDLLPGAPRSLVLGRVRYVEGVRRKWTSGTNDERLTMIVSLASHEIDAVEQVYFDDVALTLDANGYVLTEPYFKADVAPAEVTIRVVAGSGSANVSPAVPLPQSHWYGVNYTGGDDAVYTATVTLAGSVFSITNAARDGDYVVPYSVATGVSKARVRVYLGGAGQNVGAALAAEYPGKLTASDKFAGIALLVVDCDYDQDVFPQGRPNVTAVIRGAKCYDPRSGLTVWTQNPALHALKYATWSGGWALKSSDYVAADITAAANLCDVSTTFTMTMPGGATSLVTLPRYRCGITISSADDRADSMASIVETMAGTHGWAGGVWRVRAGALAATDATVDQSWLVNEMSSGRPNNEPVVTAVQTVPRAQRINRVTGSCVDSAQRYQVLPFPAIEDSVLVAAHGERTAEVEFLGVTHIAHAQHLASIAIRHAQAGLHLDLTCGPQAATVELFDTLALTMPRYGFTAKTFVVVGWTWAPNGAYRLRLAESTAAMFTVEATLTGRDPAPDSDLPSPWYVAPLSGIAVTSGTEALTDGSVLTRTQVTWAASTQASVLNGGRVEVQFREVGVIGWQIWEEDGAAVSTVIPSLRAGVFYSFRARFVSASPLRVRGGWSGQIVHQIGAVREVAGTTFVVEFSDANGVCYSSIV